eukprot:1183138-Prorocentrum_minimum.AAC.4
MQGDFGASVFKCLPSMLDLLLLLLLLLGLQFFQLDGRWREGVDDPAGHQQRHRDHLLRVQAHAVHRRAEDGCPAQHHLRTVPVDVRSPPARPGTRYHSFHRRVYYEGRIMMSYTWGKEAPWAPTVSPRVS